MVRQWARLAWRAREVAADYLRGFDERSELGRELSAPGAARGLRPAVAAVCVADLVIEPARWPTPARVGA